MLIEAGNKKKEGGSLLELLSWAFYDFANSSFSAIIVTFILPAYFIKHVASDAVSGAQAWGLALALTSFVIAVGSPLLGALADQGGGRKKWMALFTFMAVAASWGLWFVKPQANDTLMALVLLSLGTLGSEFAFIFYNSLLPDLAPKDKIGFWSGWGWGIGYLGGILSLCLALWGFIDPNTSPLHLNQEASEGVRASFVLVAVWYAIFALPLFLFTPETPTRLKVGQAAKLGFEQLKNSLKNLRGQSSLLRFFLARMFFIDGLNTLFEFGGLFAAAQFGMDESKVLMFGISLNVTAGIGSLSFAYLDDRCGPKKIMIISLIALIFFGLLAIMAPTERQFWIAGLLLGLFVGPVQASSRSFLAKTASKELMSQMFGFFNLTGRATSFLGPLLVTFLVWLTGSLAWGMSAIILFFILGLLLLLTCRMNH